jgi:pimeloyl-ACP methyl ester carboxylesterase
MRQAADRVERLALLSTSAEAESAEQRKTRGERIARIATDEVGSWIEERFKQLVHPCRADDQDLLAIYRQMALFDNGRDAALRHFKAACDRANSISTLSMITCPTLVAVGDSDHVTPAASARKMADGILNADLVIIPECGHLSPLEKPDGVLDCLSTWLKL